VFLIGTGCAGLAAPFDDGRAIALFGAVIVSLGGLFVAVTNIASWGPFFERPPRAITHPEFASLYGRGFTWAVGSGISGRA
jgi:hypothetical protein